MINIINLSKNYGERVLFNKVSLSINPQEKIGLIGPNGAGKSTLFSIIMQNMEASDGFIQKDKRVRIGYLPQESAFNSGQTVLEELTKGDEYIKKLLKEKEILETENKAGSHRYGEILHELEITGFFEIEHKAQKILAGLGFRESDFNRPINNLSGGWQMRTLLAKLLTFSYDLLLLDEPTNYLDLNAALWLKDYLASFDGAFIIISHDRAFLDEVTNYTLILENGIITKIKGNYQHYCQVREERRLSLAKQFNEQEKRKKDLQRFVDRFHGQPNKAAQVRNKRKMMERMEEVVVPLDVKESIAEFSFPQTQESGYNVINLQNVSKSYGELNVYQHLDFELLRGEKAVLVGENGAGKSTLLKILAGVVDIDEGKRSLGYNVSLGYFSQTRLDVLNSYNTVLEEAYSAGKGAFLANDKIRTILAAFFFRGDDVEKKVSILSGGEKSRLILAKLLINPPNFLLLDEPTTHLDVDAVEALIKALNSYKGSIVCISHDIYFVRSIANLVVEVDNGKIRKFPDNFDYYLEKKARNDFNDLDNNKVQTHKKSNQPEKKANKENSINRKEHNDTLAKEIRDLRKKKETLEVEVYSVRRIMENPRHGSETVEKYCCRLDELESEIKELDQKIKEIKGKFL